jgi:hypothetical protein
MAILHGDPPRIRLSEKFQFDRAGIHATVAEG